MAIWDVGRITHDDMDHAVETVRHALYDLSVEEFGKAPVSFTDNHVPLFHKPDFDSLKRRVRRTNFRAHSSAF